MLSTSMPNKIQQEPKQFSACLTQPNPIIAIFMTIQYYK